MKAFSYIVVSLLAAVTANAAATGSAVNPCELGCANESIQKSGSGCKSVMDFKCICHNQKFLDYTKKCLNSKCTPAQIQEALNDQKNFCKGQ